MTRGVASARASLDCDVAIVGAGPVGAALGALLLAMRVVEPGRVWILDPKPPQLPDTLGQLPLDLRVFALSRASERILRAAGAWEAIAREPICAYERMCVWASDLDPHGPDALRFDAADETEANLGYIVPNNLLQAALLKAFVAAGGRLVRQELRDLQFSDQAVDASGIKCRLLVGADGARSSVRRLAGLGEQRGDYSQVAFVANIESEKPHARTAWQRFLGPGTLALLPLASGQCSIVWSVPTARAAHLSQLSSTDFANELTQDSAAVLGDLTLRSERVSVPLLQMTASQYVAERCALVGDAAHVVHPLAGQGVNLGLLDAAALADTALAARQAGDDLGSLRALRQYARWRKSENELMQQSIDAFNRFLATGTDALSLAAQRGMSWVGRSSVLRREFAQRALGLAGELPRAARRALPALLVGLALWAAPYSARAADTVLANGKGVSITKAAWSYRVLSAPERKACRDSSIASCTTTRLEIRNESTQELACAAQVFFLIGEKQHTEVENVGTLVAPGALETPYEVEVSEPIDPARTVVVCSTVAERDEADSGDAPFARRAPAPCKFKLSSAPNLEDYYATAAVRADQEGVASVRLALPNKSGTPMVLGIATSSGNARIDRGALLAVSRMSFTTNCPGTQRVLPVRFKLTN